MTISQSTRTYSTESVKLTKSMKNRNKRRLVMATHLAVAVVTMGSLCTSAMAASTPTLENRPAEHTLSALTTPMLAAAMAGNRIVSVGDHGAVLLSDDDGKHFRQAREVPVGSMLTSVYFSDAQTGWAVGQWGAIIKTVDGGNTWTMQRLDLDNDRPLFSVYFKNKDEGWAVGLWSLMLHTTDGGQHWETVNLPPPPGSKKADVNLNDIFADKQGDLFMVAERGLVLRSKDGGQSWEYLSTKYAGTLWSGVALADNTLVVGGLRGSIFRSTDNGETWSAAKSELHSSITSMIQLKNGNIEASALDGVTLLSSDDGESFKGTQRADRLPFNAALQPPGGQTVLFSSSGPIDH